MKTSRIASAFVAVGLLAAPALAQQAEKPAQGDEKKESAGEVAGDIAATPARDVGIVQTKIPPLLIEVAKDPYAMAGAGTCTELSASVAELNKVLGPDFEPSEDGKRGGRLSTKAGGEAVVGAFIPFRGLIREVSGAAPAQRQLNAALDAGYARRGFLRGMHQARKCKTAI